MRSGRVELAQRLDLELAQFAVGDDEKVAASAGRVEKVQAPQALPVGMEFGVAARAATPLEALEFGSQVVQEQRLDDLQDVRFGGVVAALDPLLRRLHDGLEQGSEDGRRDRGPVEAAGVEQGRAHSCVELRDR